MASNGKGGFLRRLFTSPRPAIGCEISGAAVCAARWNKAGQIQAAAVRNLPAGAVEASPLRENLHGDAVQAQLAACLRALGMGEGSRERAVDAALVIPDQAARVFMLDFDSLPAKPAEALPLIQFRLKKSVPFDVESSTLSYCARELNGKTEVVVVVLPHAVVAQYEEVLLRTGLRPRLVTLSSLAALGLVNGAAPSGSLLLAKYSPPWFTTVIARHGSLALFRTVPLAPGPLLRSQTLEALYTSIIYFQDNFGAPLDGALLCGLGAETEAIAEAVEREMKVSARPLLGELRGGAALPPAEADEYFSALMGVAGEWLA